VTQSAVSQELVDPQKLGAFFAAQFGERRDLTVERLVAGKSNETFLLTWGEERWVLRRPPTGPLPPSTHNVLREHRIISALHGTNVPVPRPIVACDDVSVIGAPFYVMGRVEGRILTREKPEELQTPDLARAISTDLVRTLAALHAVDYNAVGLGDYGKPAGFLARQVDRRFSQLQEVMSHCRELPEMITLHDWLEANLPAEEGAPAIVHGDYGPHNVICRFTPKAEVAAVIDWELSAIGDPLTDLGWMTAMWRDPGDPGWGGTEGFEITEVPGFLRRAEAIELYGELSGRGVHHMDYYRVLALWRVAIALEGSYARYVAGKSDNQYFRLMEQMVPAMARVAMKWAGI
jgi:aminoglycoside phosphotransferase (APT) family kinase protein